MRRFLKLFALLRDFLIFFLTPWSGLDNLNKPDAESADEAEADPVPVRSEAIGTASAPGLPRLHDRVRMLLGHRDVSTTMIDTHVLNQGGRSLNRPADGLLSNLQSTKMPGEQPEVQR